MDHDGTMTQIMSQTHFMLKAIAISGENDGDKLKKLGGTVLGLGFSTKRDTMWVEFKAKEEGSNYRAQLG